MLAPRRRVVVASSGFVSDLGGDGAVLLLELVSLSTDGFHVLGRIAPLVALHHPETRERPELSAVRPLLLKKRGLFFFQGEESPLFLEFPARPVRPEHVPDPGRRRPGLEHPLDGETCLAGHAPWRAKFPSQVFLETLAARRGVA